ncbi:hypothetical protein [Roseovarius sp.]|uniref:hypothetical protein n=1 Tax=Roseovarius sp. TaxID=1486281 RepID=UPI0026262C66|nr:hypothetical protein [Roseovarius sp.]MDM8166597.1 hypothetical protein [Roseovarius sp.]
MGRVVSAGAVYFLLVFAAGFALGTFRVLVLLPRLGELTAVMLELPLMLAISWVCAGWLAGRFHVPGTVADRLMMGGVGFGLLMVAEWMLAVFVFDRPLAAQLAHYATWPGAIGLAGQVAFGVMPVLRR